MNLGTLLRTVPLSPCCVALVVIQTASELRAAEWLNYRGPSHNGVSADRLTMNWSGAVTNPVWLVPLSNSLSSFTVSGGRAFTQINPRIGVFNQSDQTTFTNREACVALNITNGARLWMTIVENNAPHEEDTGVGSKNGPRSTPVVDGDSVFVLTSYLKLFRLDAASGSVTWQKDLLSLYGGALLQNEAAASPLIENGLIYVSTCAGAASRGVPGVSNLMAFSTTDGSLVWRSQNENMTHASPILATIHGVRQVIFATRTGLVSLNASDGSFLWKCAYPFAVSSLADLCASPVVDGDIVFMTGSRSQLFGSFAHRIVYTNSVWSTTLLWAQTTTSMQVASYWMTPVAANGFLYGHFSATAGGENDTGAFKCVDLQTGTVMWSTNNFGRGGTLLADGNLLILTERGDLVLAKPVTNAYTELARLRAIPDYDTTSARTNVCWNSPAVADGKVYVRSSYFGAMYDLSLPGLKLDPPALETTDTLRLTVRASDGTSVGSNRLATMEVRVSTALNSTPETWAKLTNALVLSNGVVVVTNVDRSLPQRYFIVAEPK